MSQEILVNVTPHEVRIALIENAVLQEIHIQRAETQGLLGNFYRGKVIRVLPGIQAAFVDIGLERSAFLHVSDVQTQAPEENPDIRKHIRCGQEILVQVYKDILGTKGARLTTRFTIPSRYLVFTPNVFQVSVSQRMTNTAERERLMQMLVPSAKGGYIFRTAAEGVSLADIETDKLFLDTLWSDIEEKNRCARPGQLVHEDIPLILRVLRDWVGYDIARIRVDDAKTTAEMQQFAARYVPKLAERIEYYESTRPIFDIYSVEDELQKTLQRKVYLKSGGYLIFDQTEAMTTIDVNTGSYLGNHNLEQTIFKTNLEAADVIARQIRLRNLGGIIIVDFIDMREAHHQEQLLLTLKAALAKDSVNVQISELSSLGLVQMTRKRTRESLEHVLCTPCPLCQKRGSVKSIETVAYDIFRELKRVAHGFPWMGFLVVAATEVIHFLMERESSHLADLEQQLGKPIKLQSSPAYSQERYDILPFKEERL